MNTTRPPRRSPQRARVLAEIVADDNAGRPYRYAASVEPGFFSALLDGGYIEIREEGRHPLGGPARHVYPTQLGRALCERWVA